MAACIAILRQKKATLAQLECSNYKIALGRIDEHNPTALLDVSLLAMSKLTLYELENLKAANKSMRDGRQKPGKPRKHARI